LTVEGLTTEEEELFANFNVSAFHLETRQAYRVPEEAALLRAYSEGQSLAERPEVEEWLSYVRSVVASGRRVQRVHVVELPLSDYMWYEFSFYELSVSAGEDVRIVERGADPRLRSMDSDFWLFDAETTSAAVLHLRFDGTNQLTGIEISQSERDLRWCRRQRDIALELSTPFTQFQASTNTT
jgi:hypothetical protein